MTKRIKISNGVAKQYLSHGFVLIVDERDADLLRRYSWHVRNTRPNDHPRPRYYATAYVGGGRDNSKHEYIHRLILGAQPGQITDHANGNPMDNRRSNLRIVTQSENLANRAGILGRKMKCIRPGRTGKGWVAVIGINRKGIYLGTFATKLEAAIAYNKKALELYGECAHLNPV